MVKKIIVLILLILPGSLHGQDKRTVTFLLDSLGRTSVPQLNNEVDLSFNNIPMQELVRTLCNITGINITIDQKVDYPVNANFDNVKVQDVLNFLAEKYHLIITCYGKIIHIQPYIEKKERLVIEQTEDTLLNYDICKIRADLFFRKLTDISGYNFVLSPETNNLFINGYGQHLSLDNTLLQVAATNKLSIRKLNPVLFSVSPQINNAADTLLNPGGKGKNKNLVLEITDGLINADIRDASYLDIITELSEQADYSAQLLCPINGKTSIHTEHTTIRDFLNMLFYGSEYTYKLKENILFIGSRKMSEIKSFELIKLNNRRVDSLMYLIPKEMKQGLVIKEFPEQNSMIVWGDADMIFCFRKNIEKMDVMVPVILINVIIVDAEKKFDLETGIEAGLGTKATETSGTINPGLDYTMSATSVNNMLGTIGLTNLGKVTPNFYMKLKAMETDGIIDIRSTPQLATLNGHSATMSIGQTEYYKEASSNYWGTQTPNIETQYHYKPVEAKLGITIKPIVAGNGEVILSINVEQSTFSDRIEETAPPGLKSKKFSSIIRVNNEEMVLLGGLKENSKSSSRTGWPLLSKIPVLNWIFASKKEGKNKSHLDIFIKPTVIY